MEGTLKVNQRWLITALASLVATCIIEFGIFPYCHRYVSTVFIAGIIGGAMPSFLIAAMLSVWMRDTTKFFSTCFGVVAIVSYLEVIGRHGHC